MTAPHGVTEDCAYRRPARRRWLEQTERRAVVGDAGLSRTACVPGRKA